MGAQLAREAPADADIVVPVPDSGVFAAIGYSRESGLPFEFGLIRNHYVGRTFIEPQAVDPALRREDQAEPGARAARRDAVVLIDDSIVRGTTSRKIVRMVRDAGAAEVHLRISGAADRWPCHYGIDTPTREELIASRHDLEEIREFIEADSLAYLSLEGMLAAVRATPTATAPPAGPASTPSLRGHRAPGRALPDPHGQRRVSDASARTSPLGLPRGRRRHRGAGPGLVAVKKLARSTFGPEVLAGVGGFGGLFRPPIGACASRCWWRRPTASAPS